MLPVCCVYCVSIPTVLCGVQGVVVVVAGLARLCWGFTISPECSQEVEQRAWCGGRADWLEVNTNWIGVSGQRSERCRLCWRETTC